MKKCRSRFCKIQRFITYFKNEDGIRLLSLDGKKDVVATSYYKDVNNYLSKMQVIFMVHINLLKMVKKKMLKVFS